MWWSGNLKRFTFCFHNEFNEFQNEQATKAMNVANRYNNFLFIQSLLRTSYSSIIPHFNCNKLREVFLPFFFIHYHPSRFLLRTHILYFMIFWMILICWAYKNWSNQIKIYLFKLSASFLFPSMIASKNNFVLSINLNTPNTIYNSNIFSWSATAIFRELNELIFEKKNI